jgi:hypothetical protein
MTQTWVTRTQGNLIPLLTGRCAVGGAQPVGPLGRRQADQQ